MKKLQIAGLVLFALGLVMKVFHLPKNAIIMMIAILLVLLSWVMSIFNKKHDSIDTLKGLTISFWLIALLSTLKFWSFSNGFISIASVLTVATAIYAYRLQRLQELRFLALGAGLCILIHFIPSSLKYNLVSIKWNVGIESDYYSLDKYSWFLYQEGYFIEAQEASGRALEIANQYAVNNGEHEYVALIASHSEMIKNKTWVEFASKK